MDTDIDKIQDIMREMITAQGLIDDTKKLLEALHDRTKTIELRVNQIQTKLNILKGETL